MNRESTSQHNNEATSPPHTTKASKQTYFQFTTEIMQMGYLLRSERIKYFLKLLLGALVLSFAFSI